ncbi:acyltransferase [Agarivorans sp. 1_MG-2023]|uniref:acyltransferase n=1 Tax=Agarivorans sp. 1_MG-2023 TaxID=3062634 RepID=UPI0026E19DAD|nr:acyltransferase [Agarivorans sp. 1_MG-2023]MDO6764340.1 acyltransferase [Agarivorans sp. 1_MG-2023]
MAYLSTSELAKIPFKSLGENVKISDKAAIYDPHLIEIGSHSRIDDFCIVSGIVYIGKYCHVTPMCLIAGGAAGVHLADYCTLAYGVKVFAQSDDYTGETMVNSLIPKKFKNETIAKVTLCEHVIVGANAVIFPGVDVALGCAIGAAALVNKSTSPWGVYVGCPAKRIKKRSTKLVKLADDFEKESASFRR